MNTYNPDEREIVIQKDTLENSITDLKLPERIESVITTLPIEKAVNAAISCVKPNFPTIWLLDPYQPEHLPWEIVRKNLQIRRLL